MTNDFNGSNLDDFYRRISFIEREHAAGRGFDAPGTLGRSHFTRKPAGRRLGVAVPAAIVIAGIFGLKGVIHHFTGPQAYEQRLAELSRNGGFDRLGAKLMTADPVTLWVSDLLDRSLEG